MMARPCFLPLYGACHFGAPLVLRALCAITVRDMDRHASGYAACRVCPGRIPQKTKLAILGSRALRHELLDVVSALRQLVTQTSSQLLTINALPGALLFGQRQGRA